MRWMRSDALCRAWLSPLAADQKTLDACIGRVIFLIRACSPVPLRLRLRLFGLRIETSDRCHGATAFVAPWRGLRCSVHLRMRSGRGVAEERSDATPHIGALHQFHGDAPRCRCVCGSVALGMTFAPVWQLATTSSLLYIARIASRHRIERRSSDCLPPGAAGRQGAPPFRQNADLDLGRSACSR
jgi:hypothetical protein